MHYSYFCIAIQQQSSFKKWENQIQFRNLNIQIKGKKICLKVWAYSDKIYDWLI